MARHLSALFLAGLIPIGVQALHAQATAPVALANVHRLKCSFTHKALGTWEKDLVPVVEMLPAKLSMVFDAIDTQDGTANVMDVTAPDAGAPTLPFGYSPTISTFWQ